MNPFVTPDLQTTLEAFFIALPIVAVLYALCVSGFSDKYDPPDCCK